jgi:hypothetical protein
LFITSEYVPAAASVTPGIVGFCNAELNAFGPVHEYVAPATKLEVRFNVVPVQTGELLESVGTAGALLIVTTTVPAGLVQPFTVIVKEYVPAFATVTPAILGFCNADENAFGPVHA